MKSVTEMIDSLLDLYNSGELKKGNCNACIIGSWLGSKLWSYDFVTEPTGQIIFNDFGRVADRKTPYKTFEEWYNSMGYTRDVLMKVENIFETTSKIPWRAYEDYTPEEIKQDQLNGLSAVVDYLLTLTEEDLQNPFLDGIDTYRQVESKKQCPA